MWPILIGLASLFHALAIAVGATVVCACVVFVGLFVFIGSCRARAKRHRAQQWAIYDQTVWEEVEP